MNYPRRQQYRRLSRAAATAMASAGTVMLALAVVSAGAIQPRGSCSCSHSVWPVRSPLPVAGQAQSCGGSLEDQVRRALAPLEVEGWRLRHSLPWRGRGDIDSLAIAPTGAGFVVETKTRTYEDWHLVRVREQAAWLSRRHRRWCRRGAVPVVCLEVRPRGVERLEQNVVVVSIDRLIPVLRSAAGGLGRPNELGIRGLRGRRERFE